MMSVNKLQSLTGTGMLVRGPVTDLIVPEL